MKNKLNIIYYTYLIINKLFAILLTVLITAIFSVLLIVYALRTTPVSVTPLMVINQKKSGVAPEKRWVPVDSISPDVARAVIATEDNNFFYHKGFDVDAIMLALRRNSEQSKKVYGASTISQQTAKNVFLPPNRTWPRKVVEAGFTVLIEAMWSKARIMEVYLNVIETGEDTYGVEAAAQRYFHKSALQLSKSESTLIAVALPNPHVFNPARPSAYMLQRREQAYGIMTNLNETGWYKNIKDIKKIKVNYLEQWPVESRP
ncbi:MAG: monofunctional biosynthetic peptidoglycan transglycosylase [Prevotellaceae bacterium]|nr:monofunctional biosynthetic peptidoglycan transglycosylase [Prevotellaceae bacterium]